MHLKGMNRYRLFIEMRDMLQTIWMKILHTALRVHP
jgi:hypothetical protein